jgi:hypothetical protein
MNVTEIDKGSESKLWLARVFSTILRIAASVLFAGALVKNGGMAAAASSAATLGRWAAPGDLCAPDHTCLPGGVAAVLRGDSVLFYFFPGPHSQNSSAVLLQAGTGNVTDLTLTFGGDSFCSGVSIMPNGRVLVTGGFRQNGSILNAGTYNTTIFNPFVPLTSAWSAGANMNYPRWYPSTAELADGTMLEVAGDDRNGVPVPALESYNYKTNTWTVLPASANMPQSTLHMSAYPRLALLTNGKVFLAAPDADTYQFDPVTNRWSFVATTKFGYRYAAPHVLLPGLQKVLVAGGYGSSAKIPSTNTAEVIDFSVANPSWSYTGSMAYARINLNLVLLADGTVLAVGGGAGSGTWVHPVLAAELYNPATGTWRVMASQATQRMYHSTAVLLPDGRVVSAGSNDSSSTQFTYEIFSPPYLFAGARPVISSAPASLIYGATFSIVTPDAASIARVALLRPGATTHADNFDQRYVDLSFTVGSGNLIVTAPASGNYAPPGSYMLVIVNSRGIPSVMPFVVLS